ncbi:archaetidylserine decarboxylase [soil metagenome]
MSAFTFAAAQLMRVLPRRRVSRVMGRLADHEWSPPVGRAVVKVYSRLYDVDFDECAKTEDFTSFDDFFTRPLKDGARPMPKDERLIVSPADGRLESPGPVEVGSTYRVKGRPYRGEELVGDPVDAKRYIGGGGFVVYLSPRDYHRVHSPVAGKVSLVRSMPGDYFPVNSIGLRHIKNLFAINRRVAICIDTETLGRVTVVMVAAIVVGRITVSGIDAHDVPLGVHTISPGRDVVRGDELGQFHLGSTAVVFLEPKAFDHWLAREGPVRMNEEIAAPRPEGR